MKSFKLFLAVCVISLGGCALPPKYVEASPKIGIFIQGDSKVSLADLYVERAPRYVPGSSQIGMFGQFSLGRYDFFDEQTCTVTNPGRAYATMQARELHDLTEICHRHLAGLRGTPSQGSVPQQSVELLFGTDRKTVRTGALVGLGNERGSLAFGVARVALPRDHKLGSLERRNSSSFWLRNADDGFEIISVSLQGEQSIFQQSREQLQRSKGKRAFVFIHGYNVSFADAALRTAQLAVDLDPEALAAFYSWPSQGALHAYAVDSQNAEWSEPNLEKFLEAFGSSSGAESIVVIAHSMGSRIAVRALARVLERRPGLKRRFIELVLAAPDIDADVFIRDLVPAYAALKLPVTMYASAKDKALQFSKQFNGSPRAGDTDPNPRVANGIETVDATEIDTDFLGHAYLVETRALLTDVALLMKNRLRAAERPGLLRLEAARGLSFWKFRR